MSNEGDNVQANLNTDYDIEIFNLTKTYTLRGKNNFIKALDNINLKIKQNEIFGLLGPNGAGKTTLVSILTTLLQPTTGYATIYGRNILKESWFIKENVGLMFGGEMIYLRLTGYRNLKYYCKLYGIKDYKTKINELAERFDIKEWLDQYVGSYSKGMKLKLALARILLIEPKILILDEPMLGLDPKSVKKTTNLLKNLHKTILLTSHQMDVVSNLCDRIAFLKEGKILKVDTQENFKKMISERLKIQVELTSNKNKFVQSLSKLDFVSEITESDGKILFFIENENFYQILFTFLKDYPITHFNEIRPTLDDVFIKLAS